MTLLIFRSILSMLRLAENMKRRFYPISTNTEKEDILILKKIDNLNKKQLLIKNLKILVRFL